MENMLMFMTLTKFVVCRMKRQPLAKFLAGKENDHIIHNYKTKGERLTLRNIRKLPLNLSLLRSHGSNTSMGGIKRAVRYEEKARRKDKKILIECIMA
ncbi:odorant receptor 13a-like isoform X2 [Vespula squamosa]|uniref:Odorant receptor 13a-like isoform X2 n=1 Tax=Vespula squamosa TaxID=30214 RepID=A0ABD2BAN4_VESSQ